MTALTPEQKQLIIDIDVNVNRILLNKGSDSDVFLFFGEISDPLGKILFSCDKSELNAYCQQYTGFYYLVKLLEKFADTISGD
jgi:hypothetical protein